jgi:hypothetical protein
VFDLPADLDITWPTPHLVTVVAAMCGWLPEREDRQFKPVVEA